MSASEDKKASEAAASAKPTGLEHCTIIARDDFEIHERVGQGAFGMVYRGTWRRNGEKLTVALKRVVTVRQEANLLSKLDHPNIVKLYGVSKEDFSYTMITDFADGGSLYNFLKNPDNPDPEFKQIVRWALQIAAAVRYLHYEAPERVIHHNLKSLVVLLYGKEKVCKLCGFACARDAKMDNPFSGTIPWMSPEVIKREDGFSTSADIWCYGIVLWEMVTRKVPYEDMSDYYIMKGIVDNGSTLEIPKDCPKPYADLMEKCWAMKAEDRCDIKEAIKVLEAID